MNVERANRTGHLARGGMAPVRDTLEKEIGMDMRGGDELSK
jgi:hypothetical protein